MALFSVKTVYATTAKGKPLKPHKGYNKDAKLIEERVVLFEAKNESSALKKAEKEAKQYAQETHLNPFSQKVITEYLGWVEVYELYDDPEDGVEIFSSSEVLAEKISNSKIFDSLLGKERKLNEKKSRELRVKFLNQEITPDPEPYLKGKL